MKQLLCKLLKNRPSKKLTYGNVVDILTLSRSITYLNRNEDPSFCVSLRETRYAHVSAYLLWDYDDRTGVKGEF